MTGYALCCCSTVDVRLEDLERRDVRAIDFNYELDGRPLKDDFGRTMPPAELYRRMLDGAEAKTSQVSTGEYLQFWRPILASGTDVLQVTLSSGISGTYQSACAAAQMAREEFPERTVRVVDSLAASAGYGLLVDRLCDLRDAGMGLDELADWAEANRLGVQHWFFSTDLTFFVRGGRISRTAGFFGGALSICPLMNVAVDGSLAVVEKVRTKRKAMRRVVDLMGELAEGGTGYRGKVFISQSDCEEDALALKAQIQESFPLVEEVRISDIGATIGVHTGPGTVATFFWGTPRDQMA